MRLFRRRPFSSSDSQAEQSRLINVRAVNTDHNHQQHIPATESERDTLDDCNYQTVQAVPAVVVAESPKSSRKKGPSTWGKKVGRKWEQKKAAAQTGRSEADESAVTPIAAPVPQSKGTTKTEESGPAPVVATPDAGGGSSVKKRHWSSRKVGNGGNKRRISRVESLRNLFIRSSSSKSNRTPHGAQEAPLIDDAASTITQPDAEDEDDDEEDADRRNEADDSKAPSELDIRTAVVQPNRSFSLENVSSSCQTPSAAKKSQFPHAFIRSRIKSGSSSIKLSVDSARSCDDLIAAKAPQEDEDREGPHRYLSVISVNQDGTFKLVKRKRSFSLAALPTACGSAAASASQRQSAAFGPFTCRSEESGYESDATRNGSESPRSDQQPSVADTCDDPPTCKSTESVIQVSFVSSSTSTEDLLDVKDRPDPDIGKIINQTDEEKLSIPPSDQEFGQVQPHRRWPPHNQRVRPESSTGFHYVRPCRRDSRNRHLPAINDIMMTAAANNLLRKHSRSSSLDRKEWLNLLDQPSLVEISGAESLHHNRLQLLSQSPVPKAASLPPGIHPPGHHPPLAGRQFKMLRLVKGESGELGIYIQKKPSPDSGSLGYVIAGIERGALADRDGRLRVGDEIINVNGRRLRGISLKEAREILQNAAKDVDIVIARSASGDATPEPTSLASCDSPTLTQSPPSSPSPTMMRRVSSPSPPRYYENIPRSHCPNRRPLSVLAPAGADSDDPYDHDRPMREAPTRKYNRRSRSAFSKHEKTMSCCLHDSQSGCPASSATSSSSDHRQPQQQQQQQQQQRPKSLSLFIYTITYEKGHGKKSLGFSVVGGRDSPKGNLGIYVKTIFPSGQAAEEATLKEGDEILAVNGTPLQGLSHSEAISVFKSIRNGQVIVHAARRDVANKSKSKSCDELDRSRNQHD